MGLLSSLLGLSSSPSPEVALEIDLKSYFYRIDYAVRYRDFLAHAANPSLAIVELFLFRGWNTQFGFRIFSSHPEISERILHLMVNLSNTLGQAMLNLKYGVHFERSFGVNFIDLLQSRWQEYDSIFIQRRTEQDAFASFQIC